MNTVLLLLADALTAVGAALRERRTGFREYEAGDFLQAVGRMECEGPDAADPSLGGDRPEAVSAGSRPTAPASGHLFELGPLMFDGADLVDEAVRIMAAHRHCDCYDRGIKTPDDHARVVSEVIVSSITAEVIVADYERRLGLTPHSQK